jgi:FkbM family methyltransferase
MRSLGLRSAWALRALAAKPLAAWRGIRKPAQTRLHGVLLDTGPEVPAATRRLIYSGGYESGEARTVIGHLAPEDVVVELGAGNGFLSTLCALRIGSERVFTYEANPDLLPVIERTHAANGVRPTVTWAFLGEGEGQGEFHVAPNYLSSSLGGHLDEARPVSVPRLDVRSEFARRRPTFVIMDIEGGELDLVPRIDWSPIAKLAIELHPRILGESGMRTVLEALRAAGFREDRWISTTRKRYFGRRA